MEDTRMFAEAGEAPEAVARQLELNRPALQRIAARLAAAPPATVITCARGSSDHAATYAKYLVETFAGVPVVSAAPSVSSVFAASQRADNMLCIAISQSGRSPDLLHTVDAYKRAGAFVIALVNDATSPLAEKADEFLPLHASPETSVAATKSYICSLAAIAALVGAWTGAAELVEGLPRLPAALTRAFERATLTALGPLESATNLYVVGRGYGVAVAQEAALKLKETSGLHAEAFSAAEVRHGPMAIVGEDFPVLGFVTDDAAGADVSEVLQEFARRGARVMRIDDAVTGLSESDGIAASLAPIVLIQAFYRMVNELSQSRGFEPDTPPYLNKVTQTI